MATLWNIIYSCRISSAVKLPELALCLPCSILLVSIKEIFGSSRFHNVAIKVLNLNGITDHNIHHILKCCIDKSMLKSLEAFTKSIQEMQSKLVATLAHDIRNPLSAARLGIEMLNMENSDQDRALRVKKMTMGSVNKALQMLEGLCLPCSILLVSIKEIFGSSRFQSILS